MSSMKNTAAGMKKKLSSMKKNIMNKPHEVPQVYYVGMVLMIFFLHIMMNPFGGNLLVSVVKCSMERTLRHLPSISWNTVP